jgi:hypothetical protein
MIRAGAWPDVVAQGAAAHKGLRLPGSTLPVTAYGCLAACYAQALRDFEVDPSATVRTVIDTTKGVPGIWKGGLPVQVLLAAHFGLTAGELVRAPPQPAQAMRAALVAALTAGLAILHVDHDETRGGDVEADHFVLGRRIVADRIYFADPATGEEDSLDLRMMAAPTMWSDGIPRIYQLRSVRPLAHLTRAS